MLRLVMPRFLSCALALVLLPVTLAAQDADGLLQAAIDAFRRGDNAGATQALKELLATNPEQTEAWQLLERVDEQELREMLVTRGELGALAQRFLGLARVGRQSVLSDPGGAAEVVERALSDDARERIEATVELQGRYGEWAVPVLAKALGDRSGIDRRVRAQQALIHLGDVAVVPLTVALQSPDELVRTNAAAVLGSLQDARAAAAVAWAARDDASQTVRAVASEALERMASSLEAMGLSTRDPRTLTLGLARGWLAGDAELVKPYARGELAWTWGDDGLQGEPVFGGLYDLLLAEAALQRGLASADDPAVRGMLAAVHAAMKAEIESASRLDSLADDPLLAAARERLPTLDVSLALAGPSRADGLRLLMDVGQSAAAQTLAQAMDGSPSEVAALRSTLADDDSGVSLAAAMALGRHGDSSPAVVQRLGAALTGLPQRLVMAIGDVGLAGDAPGWELLTARTVAEGLLRAKSFPPKDVVVLQAGLQDVTLDTMVFGLRNDPRTADVPIIVVTDDVDGTETLYGEVVSRAASSVTFDDVAEVAGERSALQEEALARAAQAAQILAGMPAGALVPVAPAASESLASGSDDVVLVAVLHLVARGGLLASLPAVEGLVTDPPSRDVQVAALGAAATLWARNGGAAAPGGALDGALQEALASDDPELALAAARAMGQLRGAAPAGAVSRG